MNIKNVLKVILRYITVYRCFMYDFKQCIRYSTVINYNSEDKDKARIIQGIHAIEKGLSFGVKRKDWGVEKSLYLSRLLKEYKKKYRKCDEVVVGLNVLNAYLLDEFSTDNQEIRKEIEQLLSENKDDLKPNLGGTKSVFYPNYEMNFENILQFYTTRMSVRNYSSHEITDLEIAKATQIAKTTPTACNRQSSRIYIFKDKDIIREILDNQLGDQGWCNNANVLFVITSNQSYFGGLCERHQALIDGGLFSMNFMMGLHSQKIASCFKMYVSEPKREKCFKEITRIPSQEVPIVLIFAGHYLDTETLSPLSHRFEV